VATKSLPTTKFDDELHGERPIQVEQTVGDGDRRFKIDHDTKQKLRVYIAEPSIHPDADQT
jgi:hypothetical protein